MRERYGEGGEKGGERDMEEVADKGRECGGGGERERERKKRR